jgi:hypothetical protein
MSATPVACSPRRLALVAELLDICDKPFAQAFVAGRLGSIVSFVIEIDELRFAVDAFTTETQRALYVYV